MALSDDQKRTLAPFVGEISEDEEAAVEANVIDLGSIWVAGYALLKARQTDIAQTPEELRLEGDARVRWGEGRKGVADAGDRFLNHIRWLVVNGRITLTQKGKDLLGPDLATLGAGGMISTRRYASPNPRP